MSAVRVVRGARWLVALAVVIGCAGWASLARASNLPDGRAFELVSPAQTDGTAAGQYTNSQISVLSDNSLIFGGGVQPIGPSESGFEPYYEATRTANGWTSSSLLPSSYPGGEAWLLQDATPSLSAAVFLTSSVAIYQTSSPPPTQEVPENLEYRDAAGGFTTVATDPFGATLANGQAPLAPIYGGMSADGQTVVFADDLLPSGAVPADGLRTVYAWTPGGGAQALGRGAGDPLATCDEDISPTDDATDYDAGGGEPTNAVSSDGQTVFLQSGPGGAACPATSQVYVSVDGRTSEISVPTDGTPDPSSTQTDAAFVGATPDGQTAYFVTTTPLTSTAPAASAETNELYQWTAPSAGQPAAVTCVSCAFASGNGTRVSQVEASPTGAYVYFTTEVGTQLYVVHDGTVAVVATEPNFDLDTSTSFGMTPAGNVIVFSGGTTPANLYRVVLTGTTASAPQCITCGESAAGGDGTLGMIGDGLAAGASPRGASTLAGDGDDSVSSDGNTVVFTTDDALGTTDAGYSSQVWEWTPSGGDQFIADGSDSFGADSEITPDGQDIFLYSPDALTFDSVQPDTVALYDARVGGGFATPASSPQCENPDGCRTSTAPSAPPAVGSSDGCCDNVASAKRPSIELARMSARELQRAARTGRIDVRVTARGHGRLRVRVITKVDGRARQVGESSRTVDVAGSRPITVTLSVRLSTTARAVLAKSGHLALTVRANLPAAIPRSVRATLSEHERQGGQS